MESVLDQVKGVNGVKSVQRVVCGDCHDFKVTVKLGAGDFGKWAENGFAPEGDVKKLMEGINGASNWET